GSGTVESRTYTNDRVQIHLKTQASKIPAEGNLTQVGVRVGVFGDEAVSERILAQVNAHLAVPGSSPNPRPVPAEQPAGARGPPWPAPRPETAEALQSSPWAGSIGAMSRFPVSTPAPATRPAGLDYWLILIGVSLSVSLAQVSRPAPEPAPDAPEWVEAFLP